VLGLDTRFHAAPFHRKISVLGTPSLVWPPLPTAQALRADRTATPDIWLAAPVAGTRSRCHVRPVHRKISDWLEPKPHLLQPTAHAARAERTATPDNSDAEPVPGSRTLRQAAPFQCKISALLPVVPHLVQPTAHAFLADEAATPVSSLCEPVRGSLARRQDFPFHASTSGSPPPATQLTQPTAQALRSEGAATPSSLLPVPAFGLRARRHFAPVQCMIRAPWENPTAQASPAETAATPCRLASAGLSPRTCCQAAPFHRKITGWEGWLNSSVQPTAHARRGDVAATPVSKAMRLIADVFASTRSPPATSLGAATAL